MEIIGIQQVNTRTREGNLSAHSKIGKTSQSVYRLTQFSLASLAEWLRGRALNRKVLSSIRVWSLDMRCPGCEGLNLIAQKGASACHGFSSVFEASLSCERQNQVFHIYFQGINSPMILAWAPIRLCATPTFFGQRKNFKTEFSLTFEYIAFNYNTCALFGYANFSIFCRNWKSGTRMECEKILEIGLNSMHRMHCISRWSEYFELARSARKF